MYKKKNEVDIDVSLTYLQMSLHSIRDQMTLKFKTLIHRAVFNNEQNIYRMINSDMTNVEKKLNEKKNYGLIYDHNNERKKKPTVIFSNKRKYLTTDF